MKGRNLIACGSLWSVVVMLTHPLAIGSAYCVGIGHGLILAGGFVALLKFARRSRQGSAA